jgi:hypothetical protein
MCKFADEETEGYTSVLGAIQKVSVVEETAAGHQVSKTPSLLYLGMKLANYLFNQPHQSHGRQFVNTYWGAVTNPVYGNQTVQNQVLGGTQSIRGGIHYH